MWFDRKELLEIRRAINAHPLAANFEGGIPIPDWSTSGIIREIAWAFDNLAEIFPGGVWKEGFPPRAIEWWEEKQARSNSGSGYFHLHRDTIPILVALKPNTLKIFLVCAGMANNGTEVNDAEMNPGEFFYGNKNIAKAAGVNFSGITEHLDFLHELGLVVKVRKHPCGTWVRKVALNLWPIWDIKSIEPKLSKYKEDRRKSNKPPGRTLKRSESGDSEKIIVPGLWKNQSLKTLEKSETNNNKGNKNKINEN
jgi:hypothetical protein